MHIKRELRDISIWNRKTILSVLFRMPGFCGWSKRLLTICLLSVTIKILTPETSEITYGVSIVGKQ